MGTTITIDFLDYLSEDDKREMCRDAFRDAVVRRTEKDFERILSNAGYHLVERAVDDHFSGDMAETIKAQAIKVINGMTGLTVFKKPDAWDREASKGWIHLQQAVDEAKPQIAARVNEIIANMDDDFLRELVSNQIGCAILDKLTAKAATP